MAIICTNIECKEKSVYKERVRSPFFAKKYVFSLTLHQKISATQSSCLFHSLFGSKFSFPFTLSQLNRKRITVCNMKFRTLVFVCMYFTLDLNFRFRHFLPFTWSFLSREFSPSCKIILYASYTENVNTMVLLCIS